MIYLYINLVFGYIPGMINFQPYLLHHFRDKPFPPLLRHIYHDYYGIQLTIHDYVELHSQKYTIMILYNQDELLYIIMPNLHPKNVHQQSIFQFHNIDEYVLNQKCFLPECNCHFYLNDRNPFAQTLLHYIYLQSFVKQVINNHNNPGHHYIKSHIYHFLLH